MPRFAVNLSIKANDFFYEVSGTYEADNASEAVNAVLDVAPDAPEGVNSFEFHLTARKLPE